MTVKSLVDLVDSCPPDDGWGCSVTSDITLNGVPYAPFSKGDKLSRVADWSSDSKDRDGRGRNQYNRNYRGMNPFRPTGYFPPARLTWRRPLTNSCPNPLQTNKYTAQTMP